jgi:hypothetical protein
MEVPMINKIKNKLKNMDKRRIILIVVIIIVLIILLILAFFGSLEKFENKEIDNDKQYNFTGNFVELPNTVTVSNSSLSTQHCLNNICISNLKIYYIDNDGRAEYTITNNSSSTASGYLKINFGSESLIAVYKNLNAGSSITTISMYNSKDLSGVTSYTLEQLTETDLESIKEEDLD